MSTSYLLGVVVIIIEYKSTFHYILVHHIISFFTPLSKIVYGLSIEMSVFDVTKSDVYNM